MKIILLLSSYTWNAFKYDAVAGITVGIMAIPQVFGCSGDIKSRVWLMPC